MTIWTPQMVMETVKTLPPVRNDEVLWKLLWTRHINDFDLTFRMPEPELPYDLWDESMWSRLNLFQVPTEWIRHSSQTLIRLDVLDWYLKMPVWKENFDTDGWFGNNHPVLIALPDGTYVIKDGNHRIISRMISGFDYVDAYVMRGR